MQHLFHKLHDTHNAKNHALLTLLFLFFGGIAWGQTDYSGVYYIGSAGTNADASNKYYLCPTEGWCYYEPVNDFTGTDNGKPFLTTYKCRGTSGYDDSKAVWTIEKAPAPNSNYYYIKQTKTGKYLLANGQINTTTNPDRIRVHLGVPDNPNMTYNAELEAFGLFDITPYPENNPQYLVIKALGITDNSNPHNGHTSHKWLTTNGGNFNQLNGNSAKTNGPTGYVNTGGVIGIYTQNDNNAPFYLEPVVLPPTITFNNATNQVTITAAEGFDLYYTTNGETPTSTLESHTSPVTFTPTSSCTIQAIAVKSWANSDFEVSSAITILELQQVATPVIANVNNAISITTGTEGATIYYTTDGSTPTTSSNEYTGPLTDNVSGVPIKAIAVKENMINSAIAGPTTITLQCEAPVVHRESDGFRLTCAFPSSGVTIYYTVDGSQPSTTSASVTSGGFVSHTFPVTVRAFATASNYTQSAETQVNLLEDLSGSGTAEYPYLIQEQDQIAVFVWKAGTEDGASAWYKVTSSTPLDFSGADPITRAFSGHFDGNLCTLTGFTHALFNTVDGGTVRNVILKDVSISGSGNIGAICNEATGASRIYNVGILSGSVGGTGYTGGLVGLLDGSACVVNCFSYADITGGSNVGGIVGYNNGNTTAASINTMVMNCMFYGDITGGTTVSPIYGGNKISNLNGGLNNFNYYAYDKAHSFNSTDEANKAYNCALAVEEKYLKRFEFYRLLLNSNKKLAAIYASTNTNTVNPEDMAKWVLETADRAIDNPYPYPILKAQGNYPSIINPDIEHAPDSTTVGPNKGGKLGKTLSVTISGVGSNAPSDARITTSSLTLQRTDKDFDRFNFNYDKVQLPYYNDIGTGNYTGNRVVTGWKITSITGGTAGNYSAADSWGGYNFADRKCTKKDLYSESGRVFSQGAYFDVPYGVTAITIEPYWGKAAYIADEYYDKVSATDYAQSYVTSVGTQVNTIEPYTYFNEQRVYTTVSAALSSISSPGLTVYDNAVVLWGNFHQALINMTPFTGSTPFTLMSVDLDHDNEPDYSLIYHNNDRRYVCGIRFDFLNIPGTAQAQKPDGATTILNASVFNANDWFEITNTSSIYFSQFEYENSEKSEIAPIILLGGVYDQFVSTKVSQVQYTTYLHVGGNAWFHSFGNGTHSDGSSSTKHIPISVTGGEYEGFYLTGTYKADATMLTDNAECYISGGHFVEAAGASLEQIGGNVQWQIYNADIDNFFGGGTNGVKPILGTITTDIFYSRVGTFCGGPKFGDMASEKKVTTRAEGCTFEKFFGAGFGGNSFDRKKYYDQQATNWSSWQGKYSGSSGDKGKYYDGSSTSTGYSSEKKGKGVATDFDYEFFVWTNGGTGGRFFIKFVTFSLAQCNDVESTLTRCIINQNFYGGGNLGKVTGTATSVLNSCTVKGNVYGAGYSATLPTIEVRNAGFTTLPKFNADAGMFEPGVVSGTTNFTWKKASDSGVTLTNGQPGSDLTNHYVYTNMDLSPSNLGAVNAVDLTIKGNSIIGTAGDITKGNVYGGGEESSVNGNTEVKILGHAKVLGNVYGGGNMGLVGGNTKVIVNGQNQ